MVTQVFTFGYGQVCPFSGKKLGDHYATVVAPTRNHCREVMLAVFGRMWAFQYDSIEDATPPGYEDRMIEHARLVASIEGMPPD
jgi:hypothetical protein